MKNYRISQLKLSGVFLLLLSMLLSACSNWDVDVDMQAIQHHENDVVADTVSRDFAFIDEYIWAAENGFIRLDTGRSEMIQGLTAHGELVYYIFVEYIDNPVSQEQANSSGTWNPLVAMIHIRGIDRFGEIVEQITITTDMFYYEIIGFAVRNKDRVIIITQELDWDNDKGALFYSEYDFVGTPITRIEMFDTGTKWFAQGAHFDRRGAVAVVGFDEQFDGKVLLWDESISFLREEPMVSGLFSFTENNTYLRLATESSLKLREADLISGEIVQDYPFNMSNATSLHLTMGSSEFDYYIISQRHLYGLVLETGETEPILDFQESNINIWGEYFIDFLENGSIAISASTLFLGHSPIIELAVLSPVSRADIPTPIIITLAGIGIHMYYDDMVIDFNRRNPGVHIEIIDYQGLDNESRPMHGVERFHLELLAGNAPDIIAFPRAVDTDAVRVREALIQKGILLDLYPFIDADEDLNRADFFSHILKGYEDEYGRLPAIGNYLMITTMATSDPTIMQEHWDVEHFITIIEKSVASGNLAPLGPEITGERFLTTMLEYIGYNFIDYERGISDFESENFIRILELSIAIPKNLTYASWGINYYPNLSALNSGDIVVDLVGFAGYPNWSEGVPASEFPDVFNYIGLPSVYGGIHSVRFGNTFSILDSSNYSDIAWQFIRELLLPDGAHSIACPLRVDDFESRLAYYIDSDVERYKMHKIVHQSVVQHPLNETIQMIVNEEFATFARGNRSAEDTARIIQNRAQTYLHEQAR